MTRLLGLFFLAGALSAQYIPPGGGGGGAPTGAAGGSLAGTYPNPSLATLAQDLLFTDATYDIGKTGATRPRDIFLSRNLNVGNTATIGSAVVLDGVTNGLTVGSKIGGVTLSSISAPLKLTAGVPGAALSADIISLWTGTCNASSVLAGDGSCAAVSSSFSSLTAGSNTTAALEVGVGGSFKISANGALSAPGFPLTGTWISGGSGTTTKPYLLIEPAGTTSTGWGTAGTGLGINSASGYAGNLLDLQAIGVSVFKVNNSGALITTNSATFTSMVVGANGIGTSSANITLNVNAGNFSTASRFGVTMGAGIHSQTSGSNGAVAITPTYNQTSGTADNIDLKINRTETAVGSGAQKFVSFQVAASEKYFVDHLGQVSALNLQATAVAVGSLPSCAAGTEGTRASVNDSNAASFTVGIGAVVAAGGTTHVPVVCDGTNWRIG